MPHAPPSLTGKSKRRGWLSTSRKSRHQRGYGTDWEKRRLRILERDRYICQEHLRRKHVKPATEVDHIVPRANGGTDDDDNLQSLCHACHKAKTAKEAGAASSARARERRIGA